MRPGLLVLLASVVLTSFPSVARADDPPRSLVHLGAGFGLAIPSPAGPMRTGYTYGFHGDLWAAVSLGSRFALRPSFHAYEIGASYGAAPGVRADLALALEYAIPLGVVELIPAMAVSVAMLGPLQPQPRALGLGLSLGVQGFPLERFGFYARTTHRLVATVEEGVLVHQLEVGPVFRLW